MSFVMKETSLAAAREEEDSARAYRAPRWLPGGHLQTVYAYYLPRRAARYRRERWETPDGDFIDLDWLDGPADGAQLIVLFHGLEGCSESHYALSFARELGRRNARGVIVHFRGCSGEVNRLPRCYHAGDSTEIDWSLRRLVKENSHKPLDVVGISMGGNDLLKWLGEQQARAGEIVRRAVAVSAPVDLRVAAEVLDRGWNKLTYTQSFLRMMRRKALQKIAAHALNLDLRAVRRAKTFRAFDELFTAPVHGFRDAEDYWTRGSAKPWLKKIRVPTLLINARNDPFFPAHALPAHAEVSDAVSLEYPRDGGHVGFVSGKFPGHLAWLPQRIMRFFVQAR